MKLEIFSVYDGAVKAYLQPFFSRSKGEAIRSFTDAVNDEKSQFNKHAADYCLVYLGAYDDAVGTFAPVTPERILTAQDAQHDDVFPPEKRLPM